MDMSEIVEELLKHGVPEGRAMEIVKAVYVAGVAAAPYRRNDCASAAVIRAGVVPIPNVNGYGVG